MRNPLQWLRRDSGDKKPHGLEGRLEGYFRVRNGEITGYVGLRFLKPKGSMQIEFRRDGELLASCIAHLVIEHERFEFAIPAGPWFNMAHLVDESLEVHVISDFGATGQVRPDGQTQLLAIRNTMSPPSDVLLDLNFGRDGNSRPYIGEGWGKPELDGAWTVGEESVVRFDAPQEPANYALRFVAGAFVVPPDVARQEAEMLVNDTYVTNFVFLSGNDHFHDSRIPFALLAQAPVTTVRFRHLYATSPSAIGKPDKRLLAMRFRRLTVARVPGYVG